jgi:hypothetical protein
MANSTLNRAVEYFFGDIADFLAPRGEEGLPNDVKIVGQFHGFDRRLVLNRRDQQLEVYLHNGAIMVLNQLYINGPKEAVAFSADTLASTIAAFIVSRFAKLEV